jgi:hypothetical protein
MALRVEEDVWDDVLAFIEEGTLVPVLGPELLQFGTGDKNRHLYRLIAEHLAERYGINPTLTPYGELDEVVRSLLKSGKDVIDLYRPIRDYLNTKADAPIPEGLLRLAEIRQLNLFVTTTFDGLMVRALDRVRHADAENSAYLHFAPNLGRDEIDLSSRRNLSTKPIVFALFGRASASPNYAIHDEDVLEFIHALVTYSALSPESWLADELRKKNLLLLGCHFSDWVSRFIMRMASGNRLSQSSARRVFIVGEGLSSQSHFTEFLSLFARRTRVCEGSAVEFASELCRRWQARHPLLQSAPPDPGGDTSTVVPTTEPRGSIFISYVREDIDSARAMSNALKEIGGDVWLDERRLQPGDQWNDEILSSIRRRVRLFVPLLSHQTEQRKRGFVFREWSEAIERQKELPPGGKRRFIVPVVIDSEYQGNIEAYKQVSDTFQKCHIGHAPNGVPNEALMKMLEGEIRAMRR